MQSLHELQTCSNERMNPSWKRLLLGNICSAAGGYPSSAVTPLSVGSDDVKLEMAMRLVTVIIAVLGVCHPPVAALAQSEADELLRTTTNRWSAAMTWLKRQRDAANAEMAAQIVEAQKLLNELKAKADDTAAPATLRLAIRGDAPAPVEWHKWAPESHTKLPERLVILIHGLDEPGGIWDEAAPAVIAAGHSVARFDYPNDQSIAKSADELAGLLRQLKKLGVGRADLVCHSMGGLIARDALTRPAHYNGDGAGGHDLPAVERLILIGTPNRGSAFAPLQRVSEMREQFVRWIDSGGADADAASAFLRDGRGEAAADLEVGSAFLKDLNARPNPKGVRISVIAGRIGDNGIASAMDLLDSAIVKELIDADRIAWFKSSANLLHQELGDGVVSVDSACLHGVDDVVILNANHRTLLRRVTVPGVNLELESTTPPAIDEIVNRLQR